MLVVVRVTPSVGGGVLVVELVAVELVGVELVDVAGGARNAACWWCDQDAASIPKRTQKASQKTPEGIGGGDGGGAFFGVGSKLKKAPRGWCPKRPWWA